MKHNQKQSLSGPVRFQSSQWLAIAGVMSLVGVFLVLVIRASGPYASLEAESASLAGPTLAIVDAAAAGGRAVVFNAPSSPTMIRRFPGDPNPKLYSKAYWGGAIDNNGSPSAHEAATGASLSIRRTFWVWDSTKGNYYANMYPTVQDDLSHNRLPFVSIKSGGWSATAAGTYDTQIDAMLRKLDSYGKPIWLVFNHEPEGGGGNGNVPDDPGGAPAWRAMQQHIRARMNLVGTRNIAFMPVLMSYTWNTASGRRPADWWVDGIWDAYIADHYHDAVSGDMFTAQWTSFVAFAEAKNMPFGTAEWGNRGTDSVAAAEMQAFWDWSFTNHKDLIAQTYFDSASNSPTGSWALIGEPLIKFNTILRSDGRVQRINGL